MPRRTTVIDSIDGECSGKMRSTPTPPEILRTVNVSLTPPCLRAMQTPRTPGALLLALANADVDPQGIARAEVRQIVPQILLLGLDKRVHCYP
jgi:hypothetical protein